MAATRCQSGARGSRPLVERLAAQADCQWRGLSNEEDGEGGLVTLAYSSKAYASRRAPDEIESVLASLDKAAIDLLQRSFDGGPLGLWEFLRAVVQTGTYKPNRMLPFVAGAVDLFMEVMWSRQSGEKVEIRWGDLMNHLLERPEMVFWRGAVKSAPMQMYLGNFVDGAKHAGPSSIQALCWIRNWDITATIENGSTISLRSASSGPRELAPELPPGFTGTTFDSEFKVLALAWDEKQDLVALLSNRMVVQWRLRNREGNSHFQQLRVLLTRAGASPPGNSSPHGSESSLASGVERFQDKKAYAYLHALNRRSGLDEESWLQELQTDRRATSEAMQMAIWWSPRAKQWVTSNRQGRLFFWDLRAFDRVIDGSDVHFLNPSHVLMAHSDVVTGYTELDANHFATCSMDETIVIWDSRFWVHETTLRGHTSRVLSQAYLPGTSGLVSVGHERLVYVWSITISGAGACRAKLKGHEANLLRVAASEKVFFTLDEAANVLLWDATYLTLLQTLSCGSWKPQQMFCMPSRGRICVAGRRLYYIEANEALAAAMGASPSLEEQAIKQHLQDTVNLRRSGAPRWCGLSASRGCFLSATEYEVRFHPRSHPAQPRVVFCAPEGDVITAFAASGRLSVAVCCTARGDIHLLKYRSGYVSAVHKTKPVNPEEALANTRAGAMGSLSEAEGRDRGRGVQPESPEANRGSKLSSQKVSWDAHIQCAAICESLQRVYVGIGDGQVLVIACEPGFPIIRALSNPNDQSAVTCLHCSEDTGLLIVGTLNGLVHLYMLENLRIAGSMNIPLWLRKGPGRGYGSPLQTAHLFNVPVNLDLPSALLTVNENSRFQLWGVRVHPNEGKLVDVHTVRDVQLRAVHPKDGSKESVGKLGDNGLWTCGHKLVQVFEWDREADPIQLTAMAVVTGRMALPGRRLEDEKQSSMESDDETSGSSDDDDDDDANKEPPEVVVERLRCRPTTPCESRWEAVEVDGSGYPFVADENGWIWCVDMKGTIAASLKQQETTQLNVNPTRKQQLYRRLAMKRAPSRGTMMAIKQVDFNETPLPYASTLSLPDSDNSEDEDEPFVLCTPVAWLAHNSGVATLTASGPYPALVSVGLDKEIKVWSTQGDLWGQFSMLGTEGQLVPPVWPPPQVLASQVALMNIAEEFCDGVGRHSSLFLSLKGAGRRWRRRATTFSTRNVASLGGGVAKQVVRSKSISLLESPPGRRGSMAPAQGRMGPRRAHANILELPAAMRRSAPGGLGALDLSTPGASAAGSKSPASSKSPSSVLSRQLSKESSSSLTLSAIPERRGPPRGQRASVTLPPQALSAEIGCAASPSPASRRTSCAVRKASCASVKSEAEIDEADCLQTDDDETPISEELAPVSPTSPGLGRSRRSGFTSEQMEKMVQHHAFSSGCRSFQEFESHTQARVAARKSMQGIRERALRSDFWDRPTSGLGIRVARANSKETTSRKGMGRKSASESALLRYVQGSVAEMTRTVREDMGVDVQGLTREQIMRRSFIGRLDLAGVSHDPNDSTSVTSQVAAQLSRPVREKRKLPNIFAATGKESLSSTTRSGGGPSKGRAGRNAGRA